MMTIVRSLTLRDWAAMLAVASLIALAIAVRNYPAAAVAGILLGAMLAAIAWQHAADDALALAKTTLADYEVLAAHCAADLARMRWLEERAQDSVVTIAVELDGGVALSVATIGQSEETHFREKNSVRDAIDAARGETVGG